jgi:hypothetical protein
MTAGTIGRHRPSISRGSALHNDAGGLLTPRSSALTLPSQAGGPGGDGGSSSLVTVARTVSDLHRLPGSALPSPVSPPITKPCGQASLDASVTRGFASATPARDVSSRTKTWQRPPAASVAPVPDTTDWRSLVCQARRARAPARPTTGVGQAAEGVALRCRLKCSWAGHRTAQRPDRRVSVRRGTGAR